MIIITGAAGFIGSCLLKRLNDEGYTDLVIVDDFSIEKKTSNWETKIFSQKVERKDFFEWAEGKGNLIQFIFHIGARTDTTESSREILETLNLEYSKNIWNLCVNEGIPLIYASSAATYGMGDYGFTEDSEHINDLKPLNLYGQSKHDFDLWALSQEKKPYFWAGLKFFNVYGPNEYHKGRMASVIFHSYHQIQKTRALKLFKSHKPEYRDGEQKRDFIYIMDLLDVLMFLMLKRKESGLYNLGTGKAHTFNELAGAIFETLEMEPDIIYIDTPEDIRQKYQYFTEADMNKLRISGYDKPFMNINEGVNHYIRHYLTEQKIY